MTVTTSIGERQKELGAAAYESGVPREENPYKWPRNFGERNLRAWWWQGWDEAAKGGGSR